MKNKILNEEIAREIEKQKQDVARYALLEVLSLAKKNKKIKIGLGSGSTVALFVKELAKYKSKINASYYASSKQILNEAKNQGINAELIEKSQSIDITIDGIDGIDARKNALKGLGAFAIYGEKLIDYNAKKLIFIGDSRKLKARLDLSKIIVAAKNVKALKVFGKINKVAKDDYGNDIYMFMPKFKLPPKLMEKLLDRYGFGGIFTRHNKEKTKIVIANSRKFQLALDVNLKKAKEIIKENRDILHCFDYIEVGTPLIKEKGIKVVREINSLLKKQRWQGKVFADMKIADVGALESSIAFKNNADMISVLANSCNETIREVLKTAKQNNKEVLIDFIDVKLDELVTRAKEIEEIVRKENLNVYFCFHVAIDAQTGYYAKVFVKALNKLRKLKEKSSLFKIAVAGGINYSNVDKILQFNPDLVIVGSAITKAKTKEREKIILDLWKKIKFITY